MLIRSEKIHKENNYIEYITKDTSNKIHDKINDIRKELVKVPDCLSRKKKHLKQIRKKLHETAKNKQIARTERTRLLTELTEISLNPKFKKNMISDYRDDNYANSQDIEYMFDDLDDYYKPILVQGLLNGSYQRYS